MTGGALRRTVTLVALSVLAQRKPAHANQAPEAPATQDASPTEPPPPAPPAQEPAPATTPAPASALAPAETVAPAVQATDKGGSAAPAVETEKAGKKKRRKKATFSSEGALGAEDGGPDLGRIEVGGRVFARAALARQPQTRVDATGTPIEEDVESLDLSVPSARLRAQYRAPMKWLSAEVEADFAGNPELKDAFVRARPSYFLAQAGQFKVPFSAFRLESPWDLPVAGRGFIDDVLVDRFQVAGRRPGWAFGVRTKADVRSELVVGSFQGSVLDDATTGDFDPIEELGLDSQSLAARATVRVGELTLGAAYEHRVGSPEVLEVEHYATGNVDAVLDMPVASGGLRLWGEVIAGESWYEHESKPADQTDPIFVALRLIAAFRFGGASYGERYIEPYAMIAGLDPDTDVTADAALEGVLGANVGLWDLVRLGLQAELVRVSRNFPRAVYLGRELDRTALVLQAGLEF